MFSTNYLSDIICPYNNSLMLFGSVLHSPVHQEVEPVVGGEEPEAEVLELSEAEVAELVQQQQATHHQQQVSRSSHVRD